MATYREFAFRNLATLWHQPAGGSSKTHLIVPDGCTDLVLQDSTIRIVGPMTRARVVESCPSDVWGIRFAQGVVVGLIGVSPKELRDCVESAPRLPGLGSAVKKPTYASVLEALGHLTRTYTQTEEARRCAYIAERLKKAPATTVKVLALEVGWSERHLRRCFVEQTGLTPKRFARVMRFQRFATWIHAEPTLADLAYRSGYADQAHMTRECKAHTGLTPRAYRRHTSPP